MLFRLILLLAIAAALTVFTVQNLTPLLPLVFLGIQFPALPLSWWVLGAMAAGVASMLAIQGLIGVSNFVTGQSVRSRVRASATRAASSRDYEGSSEPEVTGAWKRQPRRDRSRAGDDSAWQDWRGYDATATQTTARTPTTPVDDWERPPSEDWEVPAPQDAPPRTPPDRVPPRDSQPDERSPGFRRNSPAEDRSSSSRSQSSADSSYSYSAQDPQDTAVGKTEKVVDADYRVIVPPYRPLDEPVPPVYTPPPPPPPVSEENADDWFEETSDDFGDATPPPKPTAENQAP